jgi:hypothetical protein
MADGGSWPAKIAGGPGSRNTDWQRRIHRRGRGGRRVSRRRWRVPVVCGIWSMADGPAATGRSGCTRSVVLRRPTRDGKQAFGRSSASWIFLWPRIGPLSLPYAGSMMASGDARLASELARRRRFGGPAVEGAGGLRSTRPREAPDGAGFARRCPSAAQGDDPGRGGHGVLLPRQCCAAQGGEVRGSGEENEAARARRRTGDTALKAHAACRTRRGRQGRPATAAWTPGRGCLWLSQMGFAGPGYRAGGRGSERVGLGPKG